jgi:hypothetical protein
MNEKQLIKRKKRFIMMNKKTIKPCMIIETKKGIMFTTEHPYTKKLVAVPIAGGTPITIDGYYNEYGRSIFPELSMIGLYKFNDEFDYSFNFNELVFDNNHKSKTIKAIFDEYVKRGILINVA